MAYPMSEPIGEPGTTDIGTILLGAIGIAVLAIGFSEAYFLCALWPTHTTPATAGGTPPWDTEVRFFGWTLTLHSDVRFLWFVASTGALGSFVHIATSFADFAGNKSITKSWLWWYVLRTPIGIALGLFFYFLLRAGLLTTAGATNASDSELNPYGIAAIGALAGMFSKQATDKTGNGDDKRDGKLTPTPS